MKNDGKVTYLSSNLNDDIDGIPLKELLQVMELSKLLKKQQTILRFF